MIAEFTNFACRGQRRRSRFRNHLPAQRESPVNKYIANSAGFVCAATTNYILNRIWTFCQPRPAITQQYLTFLGISVVGLGINNGIIYLLADRMRMNFYLSKLFAIGTVTVWNFFMNYYFTFTA